MVPMIDHFGINCADLDAAKRFYDQTLAVLGHQRVMDFGVAIGYGTEEPDFWISGGEAAAGPNREVHIAFRAADAATVRAWTKVMLPAAGAGSPLSRKVSRTASTADNGTGRGVPTLTTTFRPCPRRQQRRGGLPLGVRRRLIRGHRCG